MPRWEQREAGERSAPERRVSGLDREGEERIVPSMERLGTLGEDSGVRGAVSGGNGAKWVGSWGTWKGHPVRERGHRNVRGNGTVYVFRRQRARRAIEWYLGALNYILWGAERYLGQVGTWWWWAQLYVRVCNFGGPRLILKCRNTCDQGRI